MNFFCEACELAKHNHVSFLPTMIHTIALFDLIHSDVWGPSPMVGLTDACWFITFINDYTHFSCVYLLEHKYEAAYIMVNDQHSV